MNKARRHVGTQARRGTTLRGQGVAVGGVRPAYTRIWNPPAGEAFLPLRAFVPPCLRAYFLMITLLLKILGVHLDQAGHLSHWSVDLRGGIWVGWLVLAAAVLGTAVFWMYNRSAAHLGKPKKFALASLRTLFLFMLLAILAPSGAQVDR